MPGLRRWWEPAATRCCGAPGRRVVGNRGLAPIQSADPGKLLLVGESETVGACLKWAASQLYGCGKESAEVAETLARMDAEVAETELGSGDLLFTPWMYGERSPIADERVRAGFLNLGVNHTRAQMARAI